MKFTFPSLIFIVAVFISSCVSPRVLEDMKKKNERCDEENTSLREDNIELSTKNNELGAKLEDYNKILKALERDTTLLGSSLGKMTKNYDQINDLYELLLQKNKELLSGNQSQTTNLMSKLQETERDLQKREDEIRLMEKALNAKKSDLERTQMELKEREARVNELEQIINDKDEAVRALKDKVSAALRGFEDKGLKVEEKNGKVYVSLEAKLLFASGSIDVDSQGKDALLKLAKVLEESSDVNILVEGHTDIDKLSGGGAIKDNWDLSVLRATSVVKIIKENSTIDPNRITAAGRGEYAPVDGEDSAEAKKKNRRIEVILTPKLDELFKILEGN